LKIISWDDRPEVRQKDLDDLHQILTHYWDFYMEEAYDQHPDIFGHDINNIEGYGARILGRHIANTLSKSPELKTRITGILQRQAALVNPPGPMLLRFARETWDGEKTIEYSQELLDQVLLGLEE
jgi:predicted nucleotidyltransferase